MKRKPDSLELSRLAIQHVVRRELRPQLPSTIPIRQHQLSQQIARKQWRRRLFLACWRGLENGATFLLIFSSLISRLFYVTMLFSLVGALIIWLFRPTFAEGLLPGIRLFFISQDIRLYAGLILTGFWLFWLPFFLFGFPLAGFVKTRRWTGDIFRHQQMQRDWYMKAYPVDYTHFVAGWMSPHRPQTVPYQEQQLIWYNKQVIRLTVIMIGTTLNILPLVYFKFLLAITNFFFKTETESSWQMVMVYQCFWGIMLAILALFLIPLSLLSLQSVIVSTSITTEFLLAIRNGTSFAKARSRVANRFKNWLSAR